LTVIGLLFLTGLLTRLGAIEGSVAMALLVAGTISALLANVIRTASANKR
jgi:hypothetical protein